METNKVSLNIYEKFPDQNPNPVMRVSVSGEILYFNNPSIDIITHWGKVKEQSIPKSIFQKIEKSKKEIDEVNFEIQTDKNFYLVKSVYVKELDSYNIYFQDISLKVQYDLTF